VRSVALRGDLAIASAFALLDAEHHALAIDVADFELARFAAAQAGPVERQQQRAVIEILRPGDQPLDFVGAEDDWQAEALLRIREVLAHIAPLQDIAAEEPEGADLGDDGPHGEPPLFEQIQVIAPELRWRDPIEARSRLLAKRLNDLDVAADRRGSVVATYELVAQALQ
jgi:hypothetical protein